MIEIFMLIICAISMVISIFVTINCLQDIRMMEHRIRHLHERCDLLDKFIMEILKGEMKNDND